MIYFIAIHAVLLIILGVVVWIYHRQRQEQHRISRDQVHNLRNQAQAAEARATLREHERDELQKKYDELLAKCASH